MLTFTIFSQRLWRSYKRSGGGGGGRFASHTHEVLHESLTYMIHPPPHWLSPHLLGKEVSYIGISMMETVPKLLNDTNICFRLSLYKKPSYLYREHTQSTSSQKKKRCGMQHQNQNSGNINTNGNNIVVGATSESNNIIALKQAHN